MFDVIIIGYLCIVSLVLIAINKLASIAAQLKRLEQRLELDHRYKVAALHTLKSRIEDIRCKTFCIAEFYNV